MAACRLGRSALAAGQVSLRQASSSSNSNSNGSRSQKFGARKYGTLAGAGLAAGLFIGGQVLAEEFTIHPPVMPWSHSKAMKAHDHKALRRGYQVYAQVCAACHGMQFVYWRELIGVTHTEKEVKAMAAEHLYEDGPNEDGEMYMRPGKPYDLMPAPYKNTKEARAANNGALPPDFSAIARARHGGPNYVFHILTGYYDPPAGVTMAENMHWNAYFPGNAIGMAQALYPGVMEYEEGDDTKATVSQMARDVVEFLDWSADKNHDKRHLALPKGIILICAVSLGCYIGWRKTYAFDFSKTLVYAKMPKRK